MFLMQAIPDSQWTPASIILALAYFVIKHVVFDAKKNRKDDRVEEEKTQLLRGLNQKIEKQIEVSDARREILEKLVDERHVQNTGKLDTIISQTAGGCKYRRGG